ncbi:MAG: META domain-containing protein [Saprospirales bacterium]|nr:META domain-containing protein [Saprospirales bacterium]
MFAEQPAPKILELFLKRIWKIIGKSDVNVVSPLDNEWYLRKIKMKDGTNLVMDDNVIFMVINTFNDRIDGFGACNKFASVIRTESNNRFSISKLTNDYGNCNFKKTENLFFELLKTANKFSIKNGNLILYNETNFLMAFTSNPKYMNDIITTYSPENNPIDETKSSNLSDEKNTSYKEPFKPATIKETKSVTITDEIKQPLTTTNTSVSTNAEDEIQKQIDALEKESRKNGCSTKSCRNKKGRRRKIAQQEQERLVEQQRIVEEEAKS